MEISIHALLAESDNANLRSHRGNDNFYPRSPCGERPRRPGQTAKANKISIHALLAESDGISLTHIIGFLEFLSTLSLRRATTKPNKHKPTKEISIHALLAESDRSWTILYSCPGNFYPRSPCGERPKSDTATAFPLSFLSTLSLRRATAPNRRPCPRSKNFYPRSPCGERR